MVRKNSHPGENTVFWVLFGSDEGNIDEESIKSDNTLIMDNIFLQCLPDTRKILQSKFTNEADSNNPNQFKLNIGQWPKDIKDSLIPLKILSAEEAKASAWRGQPLFFELFLPLRSLDCSYAYRACLGVEYDRISKIKTPQLFNIIQRDSNDMLFNINFHSIYLHDNNWHDFSFIHATDSHICLRNDIIPKALNYVPRGYINYNGNFREFIRHANNLHRRKDVDFIILTGDLVDYINIPRRFDKGRFQPADNFELFRDLILAWPKSEDIVVDEELEVPIYTVLGNHDYRPNEYPLIGEYELDFDFSEYISAAALGYAVLGPIGFIGAIYGLLAGKGYPLKTSNQYSGFGINQLEARQYESYPGYSMPKFDQDDAVDHVSHIDGTPFQYQALINPDLDYAIDLGMHKIVLLDSGRDAGAPESKNALYLLNYWYHATDQASKFRAQIVDTEGFSSDQIAFLENQIKGSNGSIVVAFHAPMANARMHPPKVYDHNEQAKINSYRESVRGNIKKGKREEERTDDDLNLALGVVSQRFEEFMEVVINKIGNGKKAQLILAGHTHNSVEYRFQKNDEGVQFFHDYYTDNRIDGVRPWCRWANPGLNPKEAGMHDYPDPLDKSIDKAKWWAKHAPLHIQTMSVGPQSECGSGVGFLKVNVRKDVIHNIDRIFLAETVPCNLKQVLDPLDKKSVRNALNSNGCAKHFEKSDLRISELIECHFRSKSKRIDPNWTKQVIKEISDKIQKKKDSGGKIPKIE